MNYLNKKVIKIPKNNDKNLAYLCGILAGDGSINFRKNKYEYSIKCVGNPKDEIPLYEYIIKPKFKEVFGLDLNLKYFNSEGTFGFVLYSKELLLYLTKHIGLPLGRKYEKIKVPKYFVKSDKLTKLFIRGLFDTDGCISFKKKYKNYPYYPVISISSRSDKFIKQISIILKRYGYKITEIYNYKLNDYRAKKGFTIISRIDINGKNNLNLWLNDIGFESPKHLDKIKKYYKNK